ncbi:hypothetical protein BHM03_00022049 [Ensete ventricosum]|nr:hypothetical protein BHM03_00022049 [Ensete ventricosum]
MVASASKVKACGWRASPTAAACAINAAWRAMPSPHTSTSTDSSYDSATPEMTAKSTCLGSVQVRKFVHVGRNERGARMKSMGHASELDFGRHRPEEHCRGTGLRSSAGLIGQVGRWRKVSSDGAILGARNLDESGPLRRARNGASVGLIQRRVLEAADPSLAPALELILVQLVVDHSLNEDDQDAYKDGVRDDRDVGPQVPFLRGFEGHMSTVIS